MAMPTQRAVAIPELTFLGHVTLENGQRFNIASFPGVYQQTWKMITKMKAIACSCVFFPDGHSLFGKHMRTYGDTCKCYDLYGKVEPWGCQWFSRWDTNTQEAVNLDLPLVVVYKRGLRGDDINGLGGSQKGEVWHIRHVIKVGFIPIDIDDLMILLGLDDERLDIVFSIPYEKIHEKLAEFREHSLLADFKSVVDGFEIEASKEDQAGGPPLCKKFRVACTLCVMLLVLIVAISKFLVPGPISGATHAPLHAPTPAPKLVLWPTLRLGFCGLVDESFKSLVQLTTVALVRYVFEKQVCSTFMSGRSPFNVTWDIAYGSNFTEEVTAVRGMNRQVDAVVGCSGSKSTQKAAHALEHHHAVLVAPFATSDFLSDKRLYPYVLRTSPKNEQIFEGLRYLISHLFSSRRTRIGMILQRNQHNEHDFDGWEQSFFHRVKIFRVEGSDDQGGATIQLQAARSSFPPIDVLIVKIGQQRQRMFDAFCEEASRGGFRTSGQFGKKKAFTVIVYDLTWFSARLPESIKSNHIILNGVMGVELAQGVDNNISRCAAKAWSDMNFSQLRNFGIEDKFVDSLNKERPDLFSHAPFDHSRSEAISACLFDAVVAILMAFQQALEDNVPSHEIRGPKLRDALYKTRFEGATGLVSFTPKLKDKGGDQARIRFRVVRNFNGQLVDVGSIDGDVVDLDSGRALPGRLSTIDEGTV